MNNLLFLDTETTGLSNKDRLCSVAFSDSEKGKIHHQFFKPEVPITIEATCVSHITNKMVEDAPSFEGSDIHKEIGALVQNSILVAHNAEFDIRMLRYHNIEVPDFICTMKVARAMKVFNKHSLQYLRYTLDLDVEAIAHTADGDVKVLKALFAHLKEKVSIKQMIKMSK